MTARAHLIEKLPIVKTLRGYDRSYLRPDVSAGLVLATMLLPQGMAYAELTGLPAVTGIYTTIAALIGYSLFGPNRRLVLGPDSSLAPVIAAVVLPLALGDSGSAVLLASMLSLLAGLVCIAAGYMRLGVVTELLSKPIRIGYLNGIAVLIFVSQVPKALGFSIDAITPLDVIVDSANGVFNGRTSGAALAVAAGGVIVIVMLNRVSRLRPGVFVATVASIAVVAMFGISVEIVGEIPTGIPAFTFPSVGIDILPTLVVGAVAVTLVSFADTGALSTATSIKTGEHIDPNSEIKALGVANLLSGAFQGFATSASSSRTAVAMAVGSKTQVTGLIAAAGVVILMVAFPDVIGQMPSPTLAAIVMTASFALFDWREWRWLLRVRRSEFMLSLATALAVLTVGVLEGIGVAIALSLANFLRKEWRPHSTEVGKVAGIPGYHDRSRHPEAEPVEGLLMIRYDAPLFFANAPDFARRLMEMLGSKTRPIERVMVVANAITDIDSTGAEVLADILDDLDRIGVGFAFAGLKGVVKDRLRDYGLYERIGDDMFFPNTISAVAWHEENRESPGD